MSEENKELVRRHFDEIFNKKNLDACDELMAEDYVENAVAPFGVEAPGRVDGPRAMRETAQWLIAQFPDIQMTVERSWPRAIPSRPGSFQRERTSAR